MKQVQLAKVVKLQQNIWGNNQLAVGTATSSTLSKSQNYKLDVSVKCVDRHLKNRIYILYIHVMFVAFQLRDTVQCTILTNIMIV